MNDDRQYKCVPISGPVKLKKVMQPGSQKNKTQFQMFTPFSQNAVRGIGALLYPEIKWNGYTGFVVGCIELDIW
jgi:hypothetical protein